MSRRSCVSPQCLKTRSMSASDWTSAGVSFTNPLPELRTGVKEAWQLTCSKPGGDVQSTRAVVVDRGQTLDLGNACKKAKEQ